MKKLILNLGLFAALCWPAAAGETITYQGRLKEGGVPVDGNRDFAFEFCATQAPSGCVASPSGTQSFQVANGLFKSTFTAPSVNFAAGPWYLRVKVGVDYLSPVEKLTAVPYAVQAASSAYASALAVSAGEGVFASTNVTVAGMLTVSDFSVTPSTESMLGVSTLLQDKVNGTEDIRVAVTGYAQSASPDAKDIIVAGNFETEVPSTMNGGMIGVRAVNRNYGSSPRGVGLLVDSVQNSGTIAETYGILISTMTGGTQPSRPFALYSEDANALTHFAGPVGISSVPAYSLAVSSANGNLFWVAHDGVHAVKFVGDGSGLSGVTAASGTDSTKVLKTGDTMTGQLTIDGSSFTIRAGNAIRFAVDNSGKLGVNSVPDGISGLRLYGTGVYDSGVTMENGASRWSVTNDASVFKLIKGDGTTFIALSANSLGDISVPQGAFRVGASTLSVVNGNVGAGIATPLYRLHVSSGAGEAGDLLVITTGTANVVRMTGDGGVYANRYYGSGAALTGVPADLANALGTLAIGDGGTGATTAPDALANLGAMPAAGGAMAGTLTLSPNTAVSSTSLITHGLIISTSGSIATYGPGTGTVDGDLRGRGAVDLQTARTAATHVASGNFSGVLSGFANTAAGIMGAVAGGNANNASGQYAFVGSGNNNIASGDYSAIPGGDNNQASGLRSFAAGHRAHATTSGSFIWADGEGTAVYNSVTDQARFKTRGGFLVSGSTNPAMTGQLDRGFIVTGGGFVGISTGTPGAALDVVSSATAAGVYGQIWRNASGVIVASMSSEGNLTAVRYVGDGSGLTGVTGALGTDNTRVLKAGDTMTGQLTLAGSSLTISNLGTNLGFYSDVGGGNISVPTGQSLYFETGGSDRLLIDNLGKVAIAKTPANYLLDVGGAANFDGQVIAAGTMTVAGNAFSVGGSTLVARYGYVGIGTQNPTVPFHVETNGSGINLSNISGDLTINTVAGTYGKTTINNNSTGSIGLAVDSHEILTVSTPTRVGVGTTAPLFRLHVSSGAGETGTLMAVSTGTSDLFWVDGDGAHAVKFTGDGSGLTGVVPAGSVLRAGDTMTGQLTLAGSTLTVTGGAFSVGASTLVVVNGNVGIRTSLPVEALDIGGRVRISTAAGGNSATDGILSYGSNGVRFDSNDATYLRVANNATHIGLGGSSVNTDTWSPKVQVGGSMSVGPSFASKAVPTDGLAVQGKVGIGTATPSALLEVRDMTASSDYVLLVATGTETKWAALAVTTGGIVGVGTLNPSTQTVFHAQAVARDFVPGQEDLMFGVMGSAHAKGAGAEDAAAGGHFEASVDAPDSVGYLVGLHTALRRKGTGAGTVGQAVGIYIDNLENQSGSNVIGETMGLFIATMTAAGQANKPYAIYSADPNARSYFAGPVGIGSHTAQVALVISSAPGSSDPMLIVSTGSSIIFGVKGNGEVYTAGKYFGDGSALTGVVAAGSVQKTGDSMTGQLTLYGSTLTVTGGAFSVGGSTLSVAAGRVGIGTGTPTALLEIRDEAASSGYLLLVATGTDRGRAVLAVTTGGVVSVGTLNPSSMTYFNAHMTATDRTWLQEDISLGMVGSVYVESSGVEDAAAGGHFEADIDGSSSIGLAAGLHASVRKKSGPGNIGKAAGVVIEDFENDGGGFISNTYGVYIGTLTTMGQTNPPYALYSEDPKARTYLAGRVGISSATPSHALVISSAAGSSDVMLVVSTGSSVIFGVKGNGEVYTAGKYIGDGSMLANISLSSITIPEGGLQITTSAYGGVSGIVISTGGAIQTTGYGNTIVLSGARGMGAVDLQTGRTVAGEIASGRYSVLGGGFANTAFGENSFVGGGQSNTATGAHSALGGGMNNRADGQYGFVGGGYQNEADGPHAAVAGGWFNSAMAMDSLVGGGYKNTVSAGGSYASVVGGSTNTASGTASIVVGGVLNTAAGNYSFVGGGAPSGSMSTGNRASGDHSVVVGGSSNTVEVDGVIGFVGGGSNNHVLEEGGVAVGGSGNSAGVISRPYASVLGGFSNRAAGSYSSIGGGIYNSAIGSYATVPGGYENSAVGDYSFAAGTRSSSTVNGTFTWNDTYPGDSLVNSVANQVMFKASGGFWVSTSAVYSSPALYVSPTNAVAVGTVTSRGDLAFWINKGLSSNRFLLGNDSKGLMIRDTGTEIDLETMGGANLMVGGGNVYFYQPKVAIGTTLGLNGARMAISETNPSALGAPYVLKVGTGTYPDMVYVSTTGTVSITKQSGVVANVPGFSLPTGGWTVIGGMTEWTDTQDEFFSGTFTAASTGTFTVSAHLRMLGGYGSGTKRGIGISINGAVAPPTYFATKVMEAAAPDGLVISYTVRLRAGDTVQLCGYQDGAAPFNVAGEFSVAKIN